MNITELTGGLVSFLARKTAYESSVSADGIVTVIRVIITMMIGVVLAALWSIYDKRYFGGFIRKLISEGCTSPGNAKTLYELGYDNKLGVRRAIKGNYTFYRWIRCVEEEEHEQAMKKAREDFELAHKDEESPPKFKEAVFRADLDTAHYYIPEELCTQAEIKFSAKGANSLGMFIVLIITAIILGAVIFALPKILSLILSFTAG